MISHLWTSKKTKVRLDPLVVVVVVLVFVADDAAVALVGGVDGTRRR